MGALVYAASIVQERIAMAAESLGWTPEYHSTDEIDRFTDYLRRWEKPDADGRTAFSRDFTQAEFRFIHNERILCMSDASYFLTRYARLGDETNTTVRFKFRPTQEIYFSVISDMEARLASIELFIGKARQQYVTTLTELLIAHRLIFHPDVNCVVASADRTKSEEMARKVFFCYDRLAWWLKPKYSRRIESVPGLLEFDSINSRLSIQHGSGQAKQKGQQRAGIARGTTLTIYHISEASHIPNPVEQIEAAIFKAVHPSPKVFGVVESSFSGDVGWFPSNYKEARDNPTNRHKALFFSWPCARELYPTPPDARTFPVPYNWSPAGKVAEQIRKAELFIQNHPLLSVYFGSDWAMPMEQQWFYHRRWTHAFNTGTMSTLLQELPVDDVECMVASYDSVFGPGTIEVCHNERERNYDTYAIVGQSVEDRFDPDPDDIDYDLPRVPIVHKSNRGDVYNWELVPLRKDLYEGATGTRRELDIIDGKLIIFKHPPKPPHLTHVEYGIGVDSSTGVGSDYSVISVCRKGVGAIPDVQVAEFRSNRVGHVEIFAFAMPIALYFRDRTRDIQGYPMVGIEQIASVGDVCQKEMKRLGYPAGRFFRFGRYDTVKIKQATNKQGWFTTGWSRPILIGNFVHVVNNGWFVINSPWTIESMRRFEIHHTATNRVRMEHSSDTEDDDIFGAAISTFILHDLDTLADRSKKQFRGRESDPPPPINLAPVLGPSFSITQPKPITLDDVLRGRVGLDRYVH